jgi:hypothetical protein
MALHVVKVEAKILKIKIAFSALSIAVHHPFDKGISFIILKV